MNSTQEVRPGRFRLVARPYPQEAVESGGVRADALISITAHGDELALVDEGAFPLGVMRLSFDDIPNSSWTDHKGRAWAGPGRQDVAAAIAFATRAAAAAGDDVHIAVHCLHGKSRSAAIALAVMAAHLGPGREAEAVRMLLDADENDQICCNPGIVRMADALIGSAGSLESALEAACPRFVIWKTYWTRRGCLAPTRPPSEAGPTSADSHGR